MFAQKYWKRSLLFLFTAGAAGILAWGDTPVQAQVVGTKMHVSSMGVSYSNVGGPRRQTIALVDIRDEFGNPVNDAVVTGNWSGCFTLNGASGTTQTWYYPDGTIFAVGRAQILGRVYSCWGSKTPRCFWVFTVTGVSKLGMTYDPTANRATWASLQCR
jgi:hypothetical protein